MIAIDSRTGAVPVPLRPTVCGLEVPVSTTVNVPLKAVWAFGVKVTEMVQAAPAFSVAGLTGQLLVWAKTEVLVLMLLIVMAELCPFFRVTL